MSRARSRPRRALVTVAFIVGLVWVVVAEWVGSGGDLSGDLRPLLMDVLPWLLYQWVGLLLMSRPRGVRPGVLLYLVGITLPLQMLMSSSEPTIFWASAFAVGAGFWGISRVLLQHAVLAFPTGHLPRRSERLFIAASYVTLLATQALVIVTSDSDTYVPGFPHNPFLLRSDEHLYYTASDLHAALGAVLAGIFVVLVIRRWWQSTTAQRRTIGPISLAAVAASALFILSVVLLLISLGRPWVWPLRNQVFGLEAFFTALIPFAVLVGMIRARLDRADVADMLVRLETGSPAGHLRNVLAETLGDPTLVIATLSRDGEVVDIGGHPVHLPEPGERHRASSIEGLAGQPCWLIHDVALEENPELLRSAMAAVRLAIENERLHAAVREQLAEVRASRIRIMEASDAERRRIERDLHDGAQQRLVTVALQLELLRHRAADASPAITELVEATSAELEAALGELRELARGIHPAILTQSGLRYAVESMTLRMPLQVRLDIPDVRFPAPVEAAAYFVIAEGLTNAIRHAGAHEANIDVMHRDGVLDLTVSDDGRGGADPGAGSGLRGLGDRLAALGGTLDLDSAPGSGTRLHAVIPCA